jgi:hypothetical protein
MFKFSKISVVVLATIIAFAGVGNVNAKHRHPKKPNVCVSATASPKPSHTPKKPLGKKAAVKKAKKAAKKAKKIAKKCAVATPTASPSA